jgi:5-oxopent-3-ene-1,2,5-tricarboxylate decarboxylase / 2-hydroxyhepta-2,4-diene-1,7-dioate isomerase
MNALVKLRGDPRPLSREVDPIAGLVRVGESLVALDHLELDAPVDGAIYGVALNFKGTLAALSAALYRDPYKLPPKAPVLYLKPPNTWIGYGKPIPCPGGIDQLRMGGTLGAVIGRTACRVAEEEALDYIGGYVIVNDVSIPHESYYRPAIRQQCRDGFCPMGPWVVDRQAISDPAAIEIRISVNGQLRCVSPAANVVRPLPRLIADITEFMTLRAGDVLLIGEPDKAPLAGPGDRVRVEIDGAGWLENPIARAPNDLSPQQRRPSKPERSGCEDELAEPLA